MPNEIIPYLEMCQREGVSLQRGMNFELGHNHSVILMSVQPNAPYSDRFEDDGTTQIKEPPKAAEETQEVAQSEQVEIDAGSPLPTE